MIIGPNNKLNIVIGNLIDSNLNPVSDNGLNPGAQPITDIYSTSTPTFPVDPSIDNFNWSWTYFDLPQQSAYGSISTDIFNYASGPIYKKELITKNGNLSLISVSSGQVHKFTANVFNSSPKTTSLNFSWDQQLLLQVNDSSILSNPSNVDIKSNFISVGLNTGWTKLDIYLFTSGKDKSFSINSELGSVVDQWGNSTLYPPPVPTGLLVRSDTDAFGKKDPNINILTWGQNQSSTTFGYDIYRRGPYNSGLLQSQFNTSRSSGYYISGLVDPVNYTNAFSVPYYKVSVVNSGGETLGSTELLGFKNVISTGVNALSGVSYDGGGTLATGLYNYYILQKTYTGQGIYGDLKNSTQINNTGTVVELNWQLESNFYPIDVYRTPVTFEFSASSFSGYFLSGFSNRTRYIDSGYAGQFITGISLLDQSAQSASFFSNANNSFYLSWSGLTTGAFYNIYKTNYYGVYPQGSLIATTTGNFYIDTGVKQNGINVNGKPIGFDHIGTIGYGLPTYKDPGLISNRTYDYAVSAYDFNFLESNRSSIYTITAGDPFAPNTPSGISIISLNGFATIGWQNGVEPDLAGTIIYESSDNVNFTEGARVSTPTDSYIDFIGYSGATYFKLANFDTSENISPLSSAQLGSGVMRVDDIQIRSIDLLKTIDIDLTYSVPSGFVYNGIISNPSRVQHFPATKVSRSHTPNSNTYSDNIFIFNELNPLGSGLTVLDFRENQTNIFCPRISGINSGIGATYVSDMDKAYLHIAFFSGNAGVNDLYLNTYLTTSATTGLQYYSSKLIHAGVDGINSDTGPSFARQTKPIIMSNWFDTSFNVLSYIYNDGDNKLNFIPFNVSGILIGTGIYTVAGGGHGYQMGGCLDKENKIHISTGGGVSSYRYITGISNTLSQLNTVTINPTYQYRNLYNPSMFCDYKNNIYIFSYESNFIRDELPSVSYASILSGILKTSTNNSFAIPFIPEEKSISYLYYIGGGAGNPVRRDEMLATYSWKNDSLIYNSGFQKLQYQNYKNGGYTRRHYFERFENASLYDILQSILK